MLIYSLNKYVLNFTTNYCHIIAALGNTRMTNHICPPGSDNALEKKKKSISHANEVVSSVQQASDIIKT